jgi:DNA-binding NtrC family response regulator
MERARIVVCEKTGQWALALRRLLAPSGQRVYQTPSWEDCWDELQRSPASVVALELTSQNDALVLERLTRLTRQFPQARAMVLGDSGLARYEWAVRAAGAVHAVFTPRRLPAAARLVERHLAQSPQPELPLREAIWRRLPWRRTRPEQLAESRVVRHPHGSPFHVQARAAKSREEY